MGLAGFALLTAVPWMAAVWCWWLWRRSADGSKDSTGQGPIAPHMHLMDQVLLAIAEG